MTEACISSYYLYFQFSHIRTTIGAYQLPTYFRPRPMPNGIRTQASVTNLILTPHILCDMIKDKSLSER